MRFKFYDAYGRKNQLNSDTLKTPSIKNVSFRNKSLRQPLYLYK